ncbi:hypothetical protein D4R99_04605, partial [bacterium]
MSTIPAIDWTRAGTTTPSKYRFVLSFVLRSEIGNLELKNAPLEWKDIQLLLKRDPETHGVYITAVVNSLTFIKEGKNLLEELYASKGVFSICNLFIYYLDHSTRLYVGMPTSYKLDFNTYKLINLTKSTNGVQINALEDDLISKFQQRKNTVVDLNKLVNIAGGVITPYPALLKTLALPEINIYKTVTFQRELLFIDEIDLTGNGEYFMYPTQTLITSDFPEARNVIFANKSDYDKLSGIFVASVAEVTFLITGTISLSIIGITGTGSIVHAGICVINSDNTLPV